MISNTTINKQADIPKIFVFIFLDKNLFVIAKKLSPSWKINVRFYMKYVEASSVYI